MVELVDLSYESAPAPSGPRPGLRNYLKIRFYESFHTLDKRKTRSS